MPMFKVEMINDVLAPNREFIADFFNVHKPTQLAKDMHDIAKWNWRIPSAATYADRLEWDTTDDPINWFGEWRYRDKKDKWTTVWIRVICQGTYDKKTKTGSVTVKVKPTMFTKFESTNPLAAGIFWFYLQTFYKGQLRKYLEMSQARVRDFDAIVRERLGITQAEEHGASTRRKG